MFVNAFVVQISPMTIENYNKDPKWHNILCGLQMLWKEEGKGCPIVIDGCWERGKANLYWQRCNWGGVSLPSFTPLSPFPALKGVRYPFRVNRESYWKILCSSCVLNPGPSTPVVSTLVHPVWHRSSFAGILLATPVVSALVHPVWHRSSFTGILLATPVTIIITNWHKGHILLHHL